MENFTYITLRDNPSLKDVAAEWFHNKWGVPKQAYLKCMESYLNKQTEYGWYLVLHGRKPEEWYDPQSEEALFRAAWTCQAGDGFAGGCVRLWRRRGCGRKSGDGLGVLPAEVL